MTTSEPRTLLNILGPGILFAGAAVGVSHLIQSTRAGGLYGLALIGFILFANLAKYPAFRFGNQYAAASGSNLIEAYKRQGPFSLWVFIVSTLLTMFAGCAAISITTAGLAKVTFGLDVDTFILVLGVWAVVVTILFLGEYKALDAIVKVLLGFLTVTTLIATIMVLPQLGVPNLGAFWPESFEPATIIFIAALIGWMPAPLDTSVWQSLWSQAKAKADNRQATLRESALDFNVGFIGTTVLAVCFVIMGTAVMHKAGIEFEASAAGFAAQLIDIYRQTLGDTMAVLVGAAAMAVIFTTTLTAIDAWPRSMAGVMLIIKNKDNPQEHAISQIRHPYYWLWMAVLLGGAAIILKLLSHSFSLLIDIATTVSFLTAPLFAILNHIAMFSNDIPLDKRPSKTMYRWSLIGIASLVLFTVAYGVIRLTS